MSPVLPDGYIVAVDSSIKNRENLDGEIVIAWHKDKGLVVSRLRRYGETEVFHPENRAYEPIVANSREWKIVARVLWWIGKANSARTV